MLDLYWGLSVARPWNLCLLEVHIMGRFLITRRLRRMIYWRMVVHMFNILPVVGVRSLVVLVNSNLTLVRHFKAAPILRLPYSGKAGRRVSLTPAWLIRLVRADVVQFRLWFLRRTVFKEGRV